MWQKLGNLAFWLSWPLLRIYLSFGKRTRVIIVSPDNQVLLVKGWLGAGDWILPGGGLHFREDPLHCAIREVREETGLELSQGQLTKIGEGAAQDHGLKFHYVLFRVKLNKNVQLKRQKLEIVDISWQSLDNLAGISPATASLLSRLA